MAKPKGIRTVEQFLETYFPKETKRRREGDQCIYCGYPKKVIVILPR